MREMNPVYNYRIARCIITVNNQGQHNREAEYWRPQTVDSRTITLQLGHVAP